jgi:hypothetical protein
MQRQFTRHVDPTGSYYDRVIGRELAEAAAAHRQPIPPLEGDAATPRFWTYWRRATRTDKPRLAPVIAETYDPQDLRDRLRAVGIHDAQYPEIAREVMIGRNVAERILYGTHSYLDHTVTPAVRRVIEWIEDAESNEWRVS